MPCSKDLRAVFKVDLLGAQSMGQEGASTEFDLVQERFSLAQMSRVIERGRKSRLTI